MADEAGLYIVMITAGERRVYVALNRGPELRHFDLPDSNLAPAISTTEDHRTALQGRRLSVAPMSGVLLR